MRPVALVVGPAEHGVVRHGLALASAGGVPVLRDPAQPPAPGSVVVAEFADRLFGVTAEAAAVAWRATAERVRATGSVLVASLHDVPLSGETELAHRRAALYRAVTGHADAVLTMSALDRDRLAALGITPPRLAVLPLPVPPPVPRPPLPRAVGSVTVLGFLYPGKGHEEVVAALEENARAWPLVCAGRASVGHDDLVDTLRAVHPNLTVTGFLSDDDLVPVLQAATIPVAPNRVVGSSASITTWWSHGRRPLVPDAPLVRELAAADPDALTVYGTAEGLVDALAAAAADPAGTWLAPGVRPGRSTAATAARRAALLAGWFG